MCEGPRSESPTDTVGRQYMAIPEATSRFGLKGVMIDRSIVSDIDLNLIAIDPCAVGELPQSQWKIIDQPSIRALRSLKIRIQTVSLYVRGSEPDTHSSTLADRPPSLADDHGYRSADEGHSIVSNS